MYNVGFALIIAASALHVHVADLVWHDGGPKLPAGTKIAALEGTPRDRGIFTARLRVPAGSVVAPHTHPRAERVTVLSGRVLLGFGKTVDRSTMKQFKTGDFYVNPAEAPHYLIFEEDTELQLTCEGPWTLDFVAPEK
jgi:quercetin dioxygenase-like cupin family protein